MEGCSSSVMFKDGKHDNCSIESLEEYDNIVRMVFSSEHEAKAFFNGYAKMKGFSTRLDIQRGSGGMRYFRRFVCSSAGYREEKYFHLENRQREERPLTRCGCAVRFAVKLDKVRGFWFVCEFEDSHNHNLASSKEVVFLRSHRRIDALQKADINSLDVSRLRKCQIMDVMERQNGGFEYVGFVTRDLYNLSLRQKLDRIRQGDAETVLNLMKKRKENEIEFFCDYITDENGRLKSLFWSDAQSRMDYQCFGDVLCTIFYTYNYFLRR